MTELLPPSTDLFRALAADALAEIPPDLARHVDGVAILVEEFPAEDVLRDMGIESPFDLLGLYSGVPFGQRSVSDSPGDQDRIFLYRQPILAYWCETEEDLADVVRHVLIHEIGHHFGFSDADMEAIEAANGE